MLQIGAGLEINSAWDFCFIRSSTILLQTEVGIPLSPSLYVPLGAFIALGPILKPPWSLNRLLSVAGYLPGVKGLFEFKAQLTKRIGV